MDIDEYFKIKTDDLYREGWYAVDHPAHLLFFHFLRVSHSYALARQASKGELNSTDKRNLPKDFEKVQKTYDLLGDVQNILYRYWWQKNAFENFGIPFEYPTVDLISVLDGSEPNIKGIQNDVKSYLSTKAVRTGNSPSLLISVPIDGDHKLRLKSVSELLLQHKELGSNIKKKVKPKFQIQGKRLNAKALINGYGLLLAKSAFPDMENWRLGVISKLSPSYSSVLDIKSPRETKDAIEAQDRVLMGKITHRALKKYECIAENAARGKFPCETEIDKVAFNYKDLYASHEETIKWEEREIKRLQKSK